LISSNKSSILPSLTSACLSELQNSRISVTYEPQNPVTTFCQFCLAPPLDILRRSADSGKLGSSSSSINNAATKRTVNGAIISSAALQNAVAAAAAVTAGATASGGGTINNNATENIAGANTMPVEPNQSGVTATVTTITTNVTVNPVTSSSSMTAAAAAALAATAGNPSNGGVFRNSRYYIINSLMFISY
jgi:hypothetical protein